MSRLKTGLLAATLLAGSAAAWAQTSPTFDPAQLPTTKGKVAQYTLTPRGEIDGLILEDGTEVNTSPRISTELAFSIKPGDAVTIHGLKAKALPMVDAASITNDASGVTIADEGRHEPGDRQTEASGAIKALLHGPRGELNGALLADGTVIRLPPPEAKRMADQLVVGKPLFVRGEGEATPLGRVVAAREIGADAKSLTKVGGPPPWEHWMHAMMHGKKGPGGEPGGPGMMGDMHGPGGPDGASASAPGAGAGAGAVTSASPSP